MADLPDGLLHDWSDIATEHNWQTLLLGNGLSRHVWARFGYPELYSHAQSSGLSAEEQQLFEATPNFERVLGDLLTAIRVCKRLGIDTKKVYASYRNIQKALGEAVRAVHINRDSVPGETKQAIRETMEQFEWVFTTCYDLIIYWAMAYEGKFNPFIDHFRWKNRCEFDRDRSPVFAGQVPVYFLHGALHLVVDGTGKTFKLRRGFETLLDQFGKPIEGDPDARPLLVTEGSAVDKLEAIENNEYLGHALDQLRVNDLDTVVFGSRLSDEDSHVSDALSASPNKAVAISMRPEGTKAERLKKQVDVYGRVEVDRLLFYDATTHPLGQASLSVSP